MFDNLSFVVFCTSTHTHTHPFFQYFSGKESDDEEGYKSVLYGGYMSVLYDFYFLLFWLIETLII